MCCYAMTSVDSYTVMFYHITEVLLSISLLEVCCFLSVTSGSHGKCRVHERTNICSISCSCCEKEETCVHSCKGSLVVGYNYANIRTLICCMACFMFFSSCFKNASCLYAVVTISVCHLSIIEYIRKQS